jgi:assimilatory nitrate reductase catalytic subunit
LPGQARPDWWIVAEVARRMGFAAAFPYRSAADVFREHAALSAFENDGGRDFDLGALATLSDDEFNALEPVQWPLRSGEARQETHQERRFFAQGGFYTSDRKAQFVAPQPPALKAIASAEFPFLLNTGRVRDQWHTMTRSGMSPRLGMHLPEPFVEVHPADAAAMGLVQGGFARLATRYGACVLKVTISEGQRPGSLFAPIHWSDATASSARVGELVTPATDPFSGQPEAKATPASIAPVDFAFRGFVLARKAVTPPPDTWWARVAITGGAGLIMATNEPPLAWSAHAHSLLGGDCEFADYVDAQRSVVRVAAFKNGRLEGCLFVGPADAAPQWDAVKALFEGDLLAEHQRRLLLSGRRADGIPNVGPVICACFGVGLSVIRDALASRTATSVEEIGKALRAGTNCGSCLPELKRIVADARATEAV